MVSVLQQNTNNTCYQCNKHKQYLPINDSPSKKIVRQPQYASTRHPSYQQRLFGTYVLLCQTGAALFQCSCLLSLLLTLPYCSLEGCKGELHFGRRALGHARIQHTGTLLYTPLPLADLTHPPVCGHVYVSSAHDSQERS